MRPEIADLVYPVLSRALETRERAERGEALDIVVEQAAFKTLLLSDSEARRIPDFGGDVDLEGYRAGRYTEVDLAGRTQEFFLGIRYLLTCWLDELFIVDSPWSASWNETKLESALYGTNDRAWKFWEQAARAERLATPDAVETAYLCVMLGFRGNHATDLPRLKTWATGAQMRVGRNQGSEWLAPPELEPPTDVPPLTGRDRARRMVLVGGGAFLALLPLVIIFLVQQLGQ